MPNVADPAVSNRVQSLDIGRPRTAKAGFPASAGSDEIDTDRQEIDTDRQSVDARSFGAVVKDGIQRAGPLKSAAIELGMDQTQMSRELERGNLRLKRLDSLSPDAKAAVAEALQDAYGQGADPRERARRLIRQVRANLDELAELIA